jgi:hypothetical protein
MYLVGIVWRIYRSLALAQVHTQCEKAERSLWERHRLRIWHRSEQVLTFHCQTYLAWGNESSKSTVFRHRESIFESPSVQFSPHNPSVHVKPSLTDKSCKVSNMNLGQIVSGSWERNPKLWRMEDHGGKVPSLCNGWCNFPNGTRGAARSTELAIHETGA